MLKRKHTTYKLLLKNKTRECKYKTVNIFHPVARESTAPAAFVPKKRNVFLIKAQKCIQNAPRRSTAGISVVHFLICI